MIYFLFYIIIIITRHTHTHTQLTKKLLLFYIQSLCVLKKFYANVISYLIISDNYIYILIIKKKLMMIKIYIYIYLY